MKIAVRHAVEPCQLPKAHRRWVGLVAACHKCNALYTLKNICGHFIWERIDAKG